MFRDADSRWMAVRGRHPAADGAFVYGVRTTKIYCRPVCKARLARRANIVFFDIAQHAEDAGFRACKRCKPQLASLMPEEAAVQKVRALVAHAFSDARMPSVKVMADQTGVSKWHFQRVFKKIVGLTPTEYATLCGALDETATRLPDTSPMPHVSTNNPIDAWAPSLDDISLEQDWTDMSLQAYHTTMPSWLDPGSNRPTVPLRSEIINYIVRPSAIGMLLIAFQDNMVRMVQQSDSQSELVAALEHRFPTLFYEHQEISDTEHPGYQRIDELQKLLEAPL